jgi:sulfur-carrier protein
MMVPARHGSSAPRERLTPGNTPDTGQTDDTGATGARRPRQEDAVAAGTIRYWAAARAAAGTAEEPWDASTLGEVLDAAAARHGAALARVFSAASFLVDGVRTGRDAALADGATVEVLPPFAGGSR